MKYLKMSMPQMNIWEMMKKYEGSCIGNIGGILHLHGKIEEKEVYQAVSRTQYLHPSLRLCVNQEGNLYLSTSADVDFTVIDATKYTREQMDEEMQRLMNCPVFARDKILVRYYLFKNEDNWKLMGVYHHLICDGIALQKIVKQVYALLYDREDPGWKPSALPDMRFIASLQRTEEKEEKRNLSTAQKKFFARYQQENFVFPHRRGKDTGEAGIYRRWIKKEEWERLFSDEKKEAWTAEELYEGAFAWYYAEITGEKQVSLGRVMLNRRKKEMDCVGMYANTLPLLIRTDAEQSFCSLCMQIRQEHFSLWKNSDLSVKEIRQWQGLTGKLYETCITYRPWKRLPGEQRGMVREIESEVVEVPLRLMIDQHTHGILLTYKYQKEVYTEKEIGILDKTLERIIREGLSGKNRREIKVCDKQQGKDGNQKHGEQKQKKQKYREETHTEQKNIPDIFDCFLKEACLHPREILWIDLSAEKVKTVTYEEAAQMVVWLGEKIRKQKEMPGAGNKSVEKPETAQRQPVIGLYLKRSYRLPLAMLAVLSIEGIFYPVDIREKGTRLKAMQRQVDLLLTEEMLTAWIEQWKREKDVLEKQTGVFFAQSRREHGKGGEILAYRMSTSGSTGQPKVAEIYRKSLNLRLAWMIREFSMKGSRVLQKTKDTFDVSLWELLLPAMAGGSLVLIPDGKETDPAYLWQTIKKYKINQVHFVPSMLSVFMSWVEKNKEIEKETFLCENVLASGEELRADLVRRFMAAFPETAINNLYGPAECTIDVSYHRCRPGEKIVPIGKPVWNTELKIINRKKQEIPFGYIGEILILGDLVGKGYVSTAESENQRFISVEGKRGYRTGDLGYVDDQGEIVYVGRTDREIKHRGMRVNLAAIEKETTGLPGITHAAALVEERHLLLFVETTRTKEQVKGTLAQHLPPRYLPDILLVMEKIPCNKNGKCDYRALSEFYQEQIKQNGGKKGSDTERDDHENPRRIKSVEEDILCSINKVTGTGWIAPDDFIFDCGLDSLSVVELILELEQKGYTARFADVYETGTVKKLAQRIMEKNREEDRILRLYPDWIPLGKEQGTQKQAQKEKTEEKAKLVVAVPYAGTDPYLFHALAEKLTARGYTFLACAAEKKEQTVEELAEKIEKELTPWIQKEDTEIVLFGCCVGAALTLALGQRLERHPSVTLRLVLAGSLPASFLGTKAIKKKRILLWDLLSQKAGECFLSCLYGEKVHLSEAMYERLKEEARMYVDYFEKIRWEKSVVKADATVIFGKKDLLTLGYGKRYFQWKNFIEGNIRLVEIPGAAHYFVRSCGETVAEAVLFGE